MKKFRKITAALTAAAMTISLLSGCSTATYNGFNYPDTSQSQLKLVPSDKYYTERNFEGIKPTSEKTTKTVSSEDGLCTIEKKKTYYEVTLDYENGSRRDIGAAYAEVILKIAPNYPKQLESYIYEIIKGAAPKGFDYSLMVDRMNILKSSLDQEYQDEMEGFAEKISGGLHGFESDEKLSAEEAILLNMVPDAFRATACSVMSANGNKTESGHRITSRILEWNLGSERQLNNFHCVVHFNNGEKSFTAVSLLGMFDVLTAINNDGVMVGLLDVGSKYASPFVAEGKTCYSYDLRKSAENYTKAKDAAEYLASRTDLYTYNCNLFATDDNDIFDVEAVVSESDGKTVIRDSSTELLDGLSWSDPDYFCIVNSFVTKGNADRITRNESNIVRWRKYDLMFSEEKDKISLTRFKEKMTYEKIKESPIVSIRSLTVVHMVVLDFSTHKAQAIFSSNKDPDEIEWIDLGKMY